MKDFPLNFNASKHKNALAATFVVGSAIITFPTLLSGAAAPYLILSETVFILIFAFFLTAMNRFSVFLRKRKDRISCRIPLYIICAVVTAAGAVGFYFSASGFSAFAKKTMLPHSQLWLTALLLILPALYLAFSKRKNLLKLAILVFIGNLIVIIFLFVADAGDYSALHLKYSAADANAEILGERYAKLFIDSLPHIAVYGVVLYASLGGIGEEKIKNRQIIPGLLIGIVLISLLCLQIFLQFGMKQSALFIYPYYEAAAATLPERLFLRADGIMYFSAYFSAFIKCAASAAAVKSAFMFFIFPDGK